MAGTAEVGESRAGSSTGDATAPAFAENGNVSSSRLANCPTGKLGCDSSIAAGGRLVSAPRRSARSGTAGLAQLNVWHAIPSGSVTADKTRCCVSARFARPRPDVPTCSGLHASAAAPITGGQAALPANSCAAVASDWAVAAGSALKWTANDGCRPFRAATQRPLGGRSAWRGRVGSVRGGRKTLVVRERTGHGLAPRHLRRVVVHMLGGVGREGDAGAGDGERASLGRRDGAVHHRRRGLRRPRRQRRAGARATSGAQRAVQHRRAGDLQLLTSSSTSVFRAASSRLSTSNRGRSIAYRHCVCVVCVCLCASAFEVCLRRPPRAGYVSLVH